MIKRISLAHHLHFDQFNGEPEGEREFDLRELESSARK
jgi:hypothetical protein